VARTPVAERRKQAVQAARSVLEREGLAAVTLRRVAEEAGMPLSSLQWSLRSKQELLRELFATINAEIAEIVAGAAAEVSGVRPTIAATLRALWIDMETSPMLEVGESELVIASVRDPATRDDVRELYDAFVSACRVAIEAAAERSGERLRCPAEQLARLMVVALEGLVVLYLAEGEPERCRADLDVLAEALATLALGAGDRGD